MRVKEPKQFQRLDKQSDVTFMSPPQALYLMPSSSARCAQFPRAQDKVHFYIKLRELRDQLKGLRQTTEVEEVAYSFDLQLAKGKSSTLCALLTDGHIVTFRNEIFHAFLCKRLNPVFVSTYRGCQEDGH